MEKPGEKCQIAKQPEEDLVKETEGDELVKKFKAEYQTRGNTDLLYQVDYLSKFADRYREKDDWASLLRAHALYNSCAVRDTERREQWLEKAYHVQVKYWQGDLQSFPQHLQVALALKCELDDIRDKGRRQTDRIAELFKDLSCESGKLTCAENQELYIQVLPDITSLSKTVNREMVQFTSAVVEKAQGICGSPPIKYCVVALGSMAKGEMTPYSDLEFLFLLESKSDEVVAYFHRLAVTIYFLTGNLCETRLKVMAIPQLLGWDGLRHKLFHWFEDVCMSGFKIDGLGSWAGNIPTGGTPEQCDQFMCTVDELAEGYKSVLDNPDPDASLKGDLTALLANTAYISGDRCLLEQFRSLIASYPSNDERKAATDRMLANDAEKFNFLPDMDLTHTRQLKPDIYRYPSILILNLKIKHDIQSCDPWEVVSLLESRQLISVQAAEWLRFSFCCALFIRLSAYFYHKSQNDAISVLSCNHEENLDQGAWYVRPEILTHMFLHLVPLKQAVSNATSDPSQTIDVQVTVRLQYITVAQVRYYCAEFDKVLHLLRAAFPFGLEAAPSSLQHWYIHSAISCNEYVDAERLLKRRILANTYDDYDFYLLGVSYLSQCKFPQALDSHKMRLAILVSLHDFSNIQEIAQSYCNIGVALDKLGKHSEALVEYRRCIDTASKIYKDHTDIATALCNTGGVLDSQGKHIEALEEFNKCLDMRKRIYGYRDHVQIADVICNIGVVLDELGRCREALVEYRKCLDMYTRIYGERSHLDVALVLCNIGLVFRNQGKYNQAIAKYKKALEICTKIYGDRDHTLKADLFCNLGTVLHDQSKHKGSLLAYGKCLGMRRRIHGNINHFKIANVLCNIGDVLCDQGGYTEAARIYKECVSMHLKIYGDKYCADTANVIYKMGMTLDKQNRYTEALVQYEKSLEMYVRTYEGKDHQDIAYMLSKIGVVLHNQGRYNEALAQYYRCLSMRLRIYKDRDHEKIATVHCNIGAALDDQGRHFEALLEYNLSLDMFVRLFGDGKHPQIGQVRRNIADLERKIQAP